MLRIFIILFVILPGITYAEWSTSNVWPSYDWPMEGKIRMDNIYSALVERALAANLTNIYYDDVPGDITIPTPVRHWMSVDSNIKNLKEDIKLYYLPQYVDISGTNNFNGLEAIPMYTNAALACQAAEVPTNLLDNTPPMCINGLGPFTNDPTVGHPHGWTNAYTVNGGSTFPAGRSTWYSSDYGTEALKALINAMDWTHIQSAGKVLASNKNIVTLSSNSLSEAYSSNSAVYASAGFSGGTLLYEALAQMNEGTIPPFLYSARSSRSRALPVLSDIPTNLSSTIDVYWETRKSVITHTWEDIDSIGIIHNTNSAFNFSLYFQEEWPLTNSAVRGGTNDSFADYITPNVSSPLDLSALDGTVEGTNSIRVLFMDYVLKWPFNYND